MSLKIGIIGCGGIAAQHARAYQENGATLVAVTDVNGEAAEKFAANHGGAKRYPDHKTLLENVEAVSICSPPSSHADIAVEALRRNIPVLCEKPLADTAEAGRKITEAAEASGTLLMIAFRHRFLPSVNRIKTLIEAGRIGRPVAFYNAFCGRAFSMKDRWFSKKAVSGGGCMLDTSIHTVDIFRYLFGEIAQQHGVMNQAFEGTDVEDSSILTVRSESGVLGTFFASWGAGVGRAVLDVMGDKGRLVYEYGGDIQLTTADGTEALAVANSSGVAEEVGHFLRAIRGEETLTCTGSDGLRALEIIQNVYENNRVY